MEPDAAEAAGIGAEDAGEAAGAALQAVSRQMAAAEAKRAMRFISTNLRLRMRPRESGLEMNCNYLSYI